MWIRSQRKNALVNINFIRIINDGNYCLICGATTDGYDCELGVYSTEEKALKVLDEIQNRTEYLCPKAFQMPQDDSNEEDDF